MLHLPAIMEKIIAASLTLVLFASISLIIHSSNDQSVSAANFQAPRIAQDMLKLKPMQQGPNDQTSEFPPAEEQFPPAEEQFPPAEEQFPPSEGEMTIPDQETAQPIEKYRVNVRFDRITVHNDHEGFASGDGEYQLNAYVQGSLVDLTKLSQWRDAGLTDVSSGETVQFNPGNFTGVGIDSLTQLTLFTVGSEDDGCGKLPLPGFLQSTVNSKTLNQTRQQGGAVVGGVIGGIYGGPAGAAAGKEIGPQLQKLSNDLTTKFLGKISCKVNANDDIGKIVQTYDPPRFGAGPHTVKSDAGDFTLTYSIAVQRVQ
jgi:hypothetical protein